MKKLLAAVTSFAMSASLMTSAFASSFNVSAAGRVSAVQPNVSIGEVADVAVNKTAEADFVVTPDEVSVNPGETVKVRLLADAGSHKVGQFIIELNDSDLPQGITASVATADLRCKAVSGMYAFRALNGVYYCDTLSGGEPMEIDPTKAVIAFTLTVPSDAKPGDYTYDLSRFHVVEDGYNGVEFDATVKPGVIHILGEGETTAPSTTQTTANTTSAQGEVSVVATTKTPDPSLEIDDGFIVTPEDVEVNAGEDAVIAINCENKSDRKVAQFVVQVIDENLPISGATSTMASLKCSAVSGTHNYKELNGTWYCDTLASGEPQSIDTSKPVARFKISIPEGTAPGTYTWYLDRFHVVEDGYNGVEFDAVIKPATITVLGGSDVTTTAQQGETTAPATGTKPVSVDEGFIIKPEDVTATPGQDVTIGLMCENTSNRMVGQFIVRVDDANLPISGATATMKSVKCSAVSGTHTYKEIEGTWYCDCLESGEPQTIDTTNPVARYTISIPEDAEPGVYEWQPDRFHVVENGYEAIEFDANIKPGKITIEGDVTSTASSAETTATSEVTTASAETTNAAAETTTVTAADGAAEWKIPTVKAKAGSTVKMDVVVNGASDLAVAGAQFNIKAAAPVKYSGVNAESAAYKADIQANANTNEFAFAEAKGAGTAAADGAVVLSLSFEVPANASGTYPVEWSNAFISDTNGNDITSKVKLTDGAIVIDEAAEGEISWVIPTVHAKAGGSAKLDVAVVDEKNSALPVAGAQFAIEAETVEFSSVSAESAAYKSDIVNNKGTNEFAFGEGKGAGVAAASGDTVMTLTYNVPAGTKPGTYAVTWGGDIFVSDTNGDDITSNVTLINGAIIVDGETDGDVTWTIPEKHAKPGDTVEMDVIVTVGEKNLAVGGAQFNVTAKAPIALSSATGSDGYSADLVYNADTNEFAFGEEKGAGIEAKDGSVVLKLIYTVPADAEPGTYPVEWSKAFISDTDGNEITASVNLVDGAIIIDPDESTSSNDVSTSEDTATTTADTTLPSGSETGEVTDTTPVVTAPEGAIIWQIQRVEAEAGQTVEVPVLVLDPNSVNLPVGGAQFGVTAKTPIAYSSVSGKSDGYGSDIVANPATYEFAFADAKGGESAAATGAKVFTLTYTVPEGTEAGEYPVEWTKAFFSASNANGEDISNYIICLDGAIIVKEVTTASADGSTTASPEGTTTASATETETTASADGSTTASADGSTTASETATTAASTSAEGTGTSTTGTDYVLPSGAKLVADVTAVDGFYFNHDPRTFNVGHVEGMTIKEVLPDGTENPLNVDITQIAFKEQVSGADNPMEAYREEQTNFTYIVDVFYGGAPLEDKDGKPVTFKAYIGVKGDSNLDNKADAKDATNALSFYSKASVMKEGDSADNIRLNPDANEIINNNPDLDLDQFGAFLVDVDKDVYDADNWKTTKSGRVIDAKDASWILCYYSKMSTGQTDRQAAWNEAIQGREEKIADFLIR